MPQTARTVIKAALRLILKEAESVEPTAATMTDGLEALNDMLAGLAVRGVRISHQTLALADNVNIDDAHMETLKAMLAVKLAPEFGFAVDPQVAFTAEQGRRNWQADTAIVPKASVDGALRRVSKPARYY